MTPNQTHNPGLTSWVESANTAGADFPIQNLPFAVLRRRGSEEAFRVAVAIGDFALDLTALANTGVVKSAALMVCTDTSLNSFMALGRAAWSELRGSLSEVLTSNYANRDVVEACLIPLAEVEYALPASIGDFTDFYTSIHHARNAGRLFRPDNPLLPNYSWVPLAYHARSSSIAISGQRITRPCGQLKASDEIAPVLGPSAKLDYELELGIFVGAGNAAGQSIPIEQAEDHLFGLCLLNDWSARDIQAWEYQPLGPFLAKNFATTISPWIITLEALAPFRCGLEREADQPAPLPYLNSSQQAKTGALDVQLEVLIQSQQMRASGVAPQRLSSSNYNRAFWTMAQLVTHHTVNGCPLRPGDLFGSGTLSGPEEGSAGALLELTRGGSKSVAISAHESRTFVEDGDTIIMRGRCERPGYKAIGFGEVVATIEPALVD